MTPLELQPRAKPFRSARRFLIAVEGEKTEVWYFEGLQNGHIPRPQRVVLELISSEGQSAPTKLVSRVEARVQQEDFKPFDEVWLVVDVDRWKANLHEALGHVQAARWNVAVSNPCFEIWLQLHHVEGPVGDNPSDAKDGWGRLKSAHETPTWPFVDPDIATAVRRGGAADNGHLIPALRASHVHRLVGRLRAQ